VDRIDQRLIGTMKRAAELEIVRRIGKDRIDRMIGKRLKRRDAIALDDGVEPGGRPTLRMQVGKREDCCHGILAVTLTRYCLLTVMVTHSGYQRLKTAAVISGKVLAMARNRPLR